MNQNNMGNDQNKYPRAQDGSSSFPQMNQNHPYGVQQPQAGMRNPGAYPPPPTGASIGGNQPAQQTNMQNRAMPPNAGKPVKSTAINSKAKKPKKPKKPGGNGKWVLLGILLMFGLIAIGGVSGFNAAINARTKEYKRQSAHAASEQFTMALMDMTNGSYENAKTRLEYVLGVDKNYPGAAEKYTEVTILLMPKATATPEVTPTPMMTSTPDTRGEEDMYNAIVQSMYANNWEDAINQMNTLRDKNIQYRSIDVDGMYYIALRSWGINLINAGYLESGIYKITLAESFGPIDALSSNQRVAARSYLAGAGFWEIDWAKALEYYSNAYANAPNMYDKATGFTSQQRYAKASFSYANLYAISEDYCEAEKYYKQGFSLAQDEYLAPTATAIYLLCYPPATQTPVPQEIPVVPPPIVDPIAPPPADPAPAPPPADPIPAPPPADPIAPPITP